MVLCSWTVTVSVLLVAVTNYHKFSDLKYELIIYCSGCQSHQTHIKVSQGAFLLELVRENLFFAFLIFRGCLQSLASGPFYKAIFKASNHITLTLLLYRFWELGCRYLWVGVVILLH